MKSFADFKKSVASIGKKKEEKKPQKAMDAGAKGRRILQRREYAAKVSSFIPDDLKDHKVYESSLTRLKSKSDKGGMALLSGSRADKSAKENKARAKQLDKDIRGKGLPGATKVTGRYDEKDKKTGEVTKVKERSHVVTSGKMGKRKFKKAVKALGKKYDQDAVITQTKGGGGATLKRTRKGALPKRNIPIGKMRPGRTGEMDTRVKGKTFTYESYLRIQERGKTYSMVISWRGKLINSQMFFPSFKRPTKAEITTEVQKVYPTAIVMYFNPSMRDPTQPMLFAGQET